MQQQNEDNIDLLEALEDQEFHDELTEFVGSFPAATPESNAAYDDKMQMLTDIRKEVFGEPVAVEWEHDNSIDSKYTNTYNLGGYSNNNE